MSRVMYDYIQTNDRGRCETRDVAAHTAGQQFDCVCTVSYACKVYDVVSTVEPASAMYHIEMHRTRRDGGQYNTVCAISRARSPHTSLYDDVFVTRWYPWIQLYRAIGSSTATRHYIIGSPGAEAKT